MPPKTSLLLTCAFVIFLSGCLPYSCNRREPSTLFPSDSLSRQVADRTPTRPLELQWSTGAAEDEQFEYPSTVLRGPKDRLYVGDAAANAVYVFAPTGSFSHRIQSSSFSYPFLSGFRKDTLVVLNRGSSTLSFIHEGATARTVPVPEGPGAVALATDSSLYYKIVEKENWFSADVDGYLTRLDAAGDTVEPHVPLPGPYWRHRGFLRTWGDTLLSLTGYRPVVDMLLPGGRLDTLALKGFDSPMLSRSRAFMKGEVDTAPVLSSSAVPLGDSLYVLNLRPKHLRVDIYDRRGHLQHVLEEPLPSSPEEAPDFFPLDMSVYRDSSGSLVFAVAVHQPESELRLYSVSD